MQERNLPLTKSESESLQPELSYLNTRRYIHSHTMSTVAAVPSFPRVPFTSKEMEVESSSRDNKRSFFGLGKKKKTDKPKSGFDSLPTSGAASPKLEPELETEEESEQITAISIKARAPQLPHLISHPNAFAKSSLPQPTSPVRSCPSSSPPPLAHRPNTSGLATPRLSTSSSQIFERNVQEQLSSSNLPPSTSHAIPAHIQTENRIPAVLEASSIAITDEKCGVDEVEIITHSMHQPAVSVVSPSGTSASSLLYESHYSHGSDNAIEDSVGGSGDDLSSHGTGIGAAAAADKRRLSFISFADVVQAEQAHEGTMISSSPPNLSPPGGSPVLVPADRDSTLSTISETLRRSPSPIRLGSGSPCHIRGSANVQALSGRPTGAGSPPRSSIGDSLGVERDELTIETMRQALRKTGSGDLSGYTRSSSKYSGPVVKKEGLES